MIRVFLVDDQAMIRQGLRMILEAEPDLTIVGEAADGAEAVAFVPAAKPDVVLMDVRMPKLDGIAACEQICAAAKPPRVLMLTTFDLEDYVYAALRAGASGFLLKDAPADQLVEAIEVVARGDAQLAPQITRLLIEEVAKRPAVDRCRSSVDGGADRAGERGPAADGTRPVERRDRRRSVPRRGDGEDVRRPRAVQTRRPRPGPGGRDGVRVRSRRARTHVIRSSEPATTIRPRPRGKSIERPTTDRIRNVALVGHSGSGKTSLAEALLYRAGVLQRPGSTDEGTTVCDTEPEEIKRKMSISLAVAPFEWKATDPATGEEATYKVNLLDTPGYADFGGEVGAALAVADLAVLVVSAVDGVEVGTEAAWRRCAALGIPRLVFVNKEDKPRADFHRTLDQLRAMFGSGFVPLELPLGEEEKLHGVADVLTDEGLEYDPDGTHHTEPIPSDVADEEHRLHDEVVEEIVAGDDDQLERYLSGEVPSAAELERTLAGEMLHCAEFPVLLGSASTGVGIDRLADYICQLGPSPADRPATVTGGTETVPVPADAAAPRWRTCSRPSPTSSSARSRCSRSCRARCTATTASSTRRRPPRSACTACSTCAARTISRSTRSSPATSAESPSCRRPRATRRSPPRDRRSGSNRPRRRRRTTSWRSNRSPSPTTTSCRTRSAGWSARIRRCESCAPRRRTRRCCAGPATRTWPWRSNDSPASSA